LKHDRLIRHCRVIQNEICYNSKEVYNLYDLFHTRYSLHKQVYTHRVSKSIEFMIVDVFKVRHTGAPLQHAHCFRVVWTAASHPFLISAVFGQPRLQRE
jgi:HD superfamily phosphohydrolase